MYLFEGLFSQKIKRLKNFKIKNKKNKSLGTKIRRTNHQLNVWTHKYINEANKVDNIYAKFNSSKGLFLFISYDFMLKLI